MLPLRCVSNVWGSLVEGCCGAIVFTDCLIEAGLDTGDEAAPLLLVTCLRPCALPVTGFVGCGPEALGAGATGVGTDGLGSAGVPVNSSKPGRPNIGSSFSPGFPIIILKFLLGWAASP